jgi:hypothetical protein
LRVVGFGFNGAAIGIKSEMVHGLLVRETHDLIPAFDNALMMPIVLRSLVSLMHGTGSLFLLFFLRLLL